MSNGSHTPGPWMVRGPLGFASYVVAEDGTPIACGYNYGSVVGNANARLLAAAPDLLDALVFALKSLGDPVDSNMRLAAVLKGNAAIAKAEGRAA